MHQKRLESELTQIEEKYHQKKSKFVETSEEFQQELKRHCSRPAVDEEKYQQMVKEQVEKIRKEREERVKAAAAAAEAAAAQQQQANSEAKTGKRKATFSFVVLLTMSFASQMRPWTRAPPPPWTPPRPTARPPTGPWRTLRSSSSSHQRSNSSHRHLPRLHPARKLPLPM